VSDETVDGVRETFQRSPGKSTRRASNWLPVPQRTVFKILRKNLKARITDVLLQYLKTCWRTRGEK